jgi:hypothetical protein
MYVHSHVRTNLRMYRCIYIGGRPTGQRDQGFDVFMRMLRRVSTCTHVPSTHSLLLFYISHFLLLIFCFLIFVFSFILIICLFVHLFIWLHYFIYSLRRDCRLLMIFFYYKHNHHLYNHILPLHKLFTSLCVAWVRVIRYATPTHKCTSINY